MSAPPILARIVPAAIAGLVSLTLLSACSREEPETDPRLLDQHLNLILAREEATYNNAVAEARAREEVREREMTERINNYPTDAERNAMKNAAAANGNGQDVNASSGNAQASPAQAPPR